MKIRKSQEILFYPVDEHAASYSEPPQPALKFIPEWHKNLPKYSEGTNFFNYGGYANNLTVKSCLPVTDAFTSGYIISSFCDMQVSRNHAGEVQITWSLNSQNVSPQVSQSNQPGKHNFANIEGYDNSDFSWLPTWCIKTPKGYSSMFIHPLNRNDLPFYTIGGVIDTDGWGDAGKHPFMFKKGWEGIIPLGTPLIQVIPFKREDWKSIADASMTKEYLKKITKRDKQFKDYYKINHWKSKKYR
jgi:hypothetical protein